MIPQSFHRGNAPPRHTCFRHRARMPYTALLDNPQFAKSDVVVTMSEKFKLGVNGAGGRMGQRIVALAHADPLLTVAGAYEAAQSPHVGKDVGELAGVGKIGVPIQSALGERVDVVIDFSTPAGAVAIATTC